MTMLSPEQEARLHDWRAAKGYTRAAWEMVTQAQQELDTARRSFEAAQVRLTQAQAAETTAREAFEMTLQP